MHKHALIILLSFQVACATSGPPPFTPLVPSDKRPEEVTQIPEDPKYMKRPKGVPSGEWSTSVEKGDVVDKPGILLSEEKAWRLAQYKISEEALRRLFSADRGVWAQHRAFYEERVYTGKKEVHRLQPSWWDDHKGELGTILGITVGIVVTLGVLAVTQEVRAD